MGSGFDITYATNFTPKSVELHRGSTPGSGLYIMDAGNTSVQIPARTTAGSESYYLKFTTQYNKVIYSDSFTVTWTDSTPTYTVSFNANGGTGSMAAMTVTGGNKLTLPACTFTAPSGKEFDKWDAGKPNDKIDVTSNMTIKAIWKDKASSHEDTCPSKKFTDVDTSLWYHSHVDYVVEKNLMVGTSATTFEPNSTITRAMVVTILYRMAGSPAVSGSPSYNDVPAATWYSNAVKWATDKGIAYGYGGGKFGPNDPVTREQMAAFLMRYAKFKGKSPSPSGSLSGYTDAGKVSSWAVDAMKWTVANGIIVGTSATTLEPGGNATRAQFAAIAHRYIDKYGS